MKKTKGLEQELVFLESEVVDDDEKAPFAVLLHAFAKKLIKKHLAKTPLEDIQVVEVAVDETLVVEVAVDETQVVEVAVVETQVVEVAVVETQVMEVAVVETPIEHSNADLTCEKEVAADTVKVEKPLAKKTTTEGKSAVKKQATPKAAVKKPELDKSEETVISAGDDSIPHGKFVIRKTEKEHFVFKLFSSNHKVIAIGGDVYSALSSCKTGIESVIANAANAPIEDQTLQKWTEKKCPKWQIYSDKQDEIRFRLIASNGNIVATTNDGYLSKAAAKNGIAAIARAVVGCEIVRNDTV